MGSKLPHPRTSQHTGRNMPGVCGPVVRFEDLLTSPRLEWQGDLESGGDCTRFLHQPSCISGGRQPAESLLRSLLVVFPSPRLDDHLRMRQAREPMLVGPEGQTGRLLR